MGATAFSVIAVSQRVSSIGNYSGILPVSNPLNRRKSLVDMTNVRIPVMSKCSKVWITMPKPSAGGATIAMDMVKILSREGKRFPLLHPELRRNSHAIRHTLGVCPPEFSLTFSAMAKPVFAIAFFCPKR
ncbi:hypothetical protein MJ561_01205 [Klebsiella pneumoniae]|nr:hypothetical protein MJ561_01205 [Klebsiella pneumoniae]